MEGTRFDVLEVTTNSEEDSPALKKMPKKRPQAKFKQEKRADGRVARVGSTAPTFAEIGVSGKGGASQWWSQPPSSTERCGRRQLFCERAKNIRESCMKERAGNCEHRQLYHDPRLCAVPQQTGRTGRAGCADGSISL